MLNINLQVLKGPQNAGVSQNAGFASNYHNFCQEHLILKKNRFFEEVLQRVLFEALVINIILKVSSKNSIKNHAL